MSMHKKPLTAIEESGLRAHGLDIGAPSQLSDVFRHGVAWALRDIDSVEHMQGGANGPTIRLRAFINAQTGPTAPQPPIDNAFVAEGCEQFSPPAEPLYAAPASQQEPAAWRQWSTKHHDWDYQTNRGNLRPDTPAEPLFVAATTACPAAVPMTNQDRNDCIEAWSSQGWGDRLGEVVRICIAVEAAMTATPTAGREDSNPLESGGIRPTTTTKG